MKRLFLALLVVPASAEAAGAGLPATVNFYRWLVVEQLGIDAVWLPTAGALLGLLVCLLLGLAYRVRVMRLLASDNLLVPSAHFSLVSAVDAILDFLHGLARDACGEKYVAAFFPLLVSFFYLYSRLQSLWSGAWFAACDGEHEHDSGVGIDCLFNLQLRRFCVSTACLMPSSFSGRCCSSHRCFLLLKFSATCRDPYRYRCA